VLGCFITVVVAQRTCIWARDFRDGIAIFAFSELFEVVDGREVIGAADDHAVFFPFEEELEELLAFTSSCGDTFELSVGVVGVVSDIARGQLFSFDMVAAFVIGLLLGAWAVFMPVCSAIGAYGVVAEGYLPGVVGRVVVDFSAVDIASQGIGDRADEHISGLLELGLEVAGVVVALEDDGGATGISVEEGGFVAEAFVGFEGEVLCALVLCTGAFFDILDASGLEEL